MRPHLHLEIIDNPLVNRRADLVAKMAKDLIQFQSFSNEPDAMRSLIGRYSSFDIALCIDDARQAAMQDIVAREMAKP